MRRASNGKHLEAVPVDVEGRPRAAVLSHVFIDYVVQQLARSFSSIQQCFGIFVRAPHLLLRMDFPRIVALVDRNNVTILRIVTVACPYRGRLPAPSLGFPFLFKFAEF